MKRSSHFNSDTDRRRWILLILWGIYLGIGLILFGSDLRTAENLTGLAWNRHRLGSVFVYCALGMGSDCLNSLHVFAGSRFPLSGKWFILSFILALCGLLIPYDTGWSGSIHILLSACGLLLFALLWVQPLFFPGFCSRMLFKRAQMMVLCLGICIVFCAFDGQISLKAELFFLFFTPLPLLIRPLNKR